MIGADIDLKFSFIVDSSQYRPTQSGCAFLQFVCFVVADAKANAVREIRADGGAATKPTSFQTTGN